LFSPTTPTAVFMLILEISCVLNRISLIKKKIVKQILKELENT
jgi:hypothetical protein